MKNEQGVSPLADTSANGVPCAALSIDNNNRDEDRECNEHGGNGAGDKRFSAGNSSPADAAVDIHQMLSATDTEGKSSAIASVGGAVACECIVADSDSEHGSDDDGYSETDEGGCSVGDEDDCCDGWDELYSGGNWSTDADAAGDMQIMLEGILGEFSDDECL